jgi:hypothetical protein
MTKSDKRTRREHRAPGERRVQLEWLDTLRGRQVVSAQMIDISESGMQIALPNAITPGTYVQIRCKDYALTGMAGIKHCSRVRMGYRAGLEFSGFRWRALETTPPK